MDEKKMMVTENPLVSIVIPAYNGSNYMREAIDSALAQTYPNIEILVVNDGSTDNTREIALSYGDKIRYFEKENGGVSTALNLAIRNMRGDYFSWLSHDDVYYPNKVESEIEALRINGNWKLGVYSGWARLNMPGRDVIPSTMAKRRYGERYLTSGLWAVSTGLISGCTLLIKKSFFDDCGFFDETLRATQDYKKWFEMFHDKRILYVDQILVQSRRHSMQVTNRYQKRWEEEEELYLWMMQNVTEQDVATLGMDLYEYYSAMLTRMTRGGYQLARGFLLSKLKCLKETCNTETRCNNLRKWLQQLRGNHIYIYCVGNFGKALTEAFALRDIPIDGVVDSNRDLWGKKIGKFVCISPEHLSKKDTVIIAKNDPEELMKELVDDGFQHVITSDMLEEQLVCAPIQQKLLYAI